MNGLLVDGFADGLLGATLRATVLLLVAWVAATGLRRSSSAIRHCVWSFALVGLIAIPLIMWIGPDWRVPILPGSPPAPAPVALAIASSTPAAPPVTVVESPSVATERPRPRVATETPAIVSTPRTSKVASSHAFVPQAPAAVASSWSVSDSVRAIWAAGFVVSLLHTLSGLVLGEVRRRRARAITDDRWVALLDSASKTYAIRRRVELRGGAGSPVPLTWGVIRPVVLIPEQSEDWTESARRLVLMHELAHVKRFDVAWVVLGRIAAALFWFHPLAWFALRRLRDECEQACDDCVVAAGERPTEYAQLLLDLARSLRMPRLAVAVPMARTNLLEGRMMAMFDSNRSHAPLGGRSVRLIIVLAGLAILGIAAVRPGLATPTAEARPATPTAEAQPATPAPQEAGTGRITGVAIRDSDQKPAAGADVILLLPPPKGQNVYYGKLPLRKVVADDKGAFAFEGLAPGSYRVWANSAALTSRRQQLDRGGASIRVSEKGADTKPVELKLVAAPTITARIRDKATGKPIPGATVQTGWSDFPDDFKADAQGVALIRPLTPERYLLDVWADGHAKTSRWVNLESGGDAEETFTLEAGSSLEGLVVDSKGKPIAGAGLSLRLKGVAMQHAYVTTGPDGRYRLGNVPRGVMLTASFSKDDYSSKDVDILVSEASGKLDLTLEPMPDGGSIIGIVVDHQGQPIAGAELVNQGRSTNMNRETKTGADGRFRLDNLFQGSTGKDVLVRAKGHAPKRVDVEPGPRDKPAEVTIELDAGHSIKGRVVDDKGRPIAGVMVDFAHGRNAFSDGGRMDSDAQGRFAFDALPSACPFGFSKNGYSEIQNRVLELDGEGEVLVQMTSAGVIVGRAVDARTGKPIRNFVVQITFSPHRKPDEPSNSLASDLINPGQSFQSAEGRFKLTNLVVDMPLQVMVLADGYEKQVNERVLVANPADAQVEEFRLEPINAASLQTVRGRMVNEDGKPVAGVQLRLIVAGPRDFGSRHGFPFNWTMITSGQIAQDGKVRRFLTSTTDPKGQFFFDHVPKNLEIELVWWGKGVAPGRLDHVEGMERKADELQVEINLPAPARIAGTIDRKLYPGAVRIRVSTASGKIDYDDHEMQLGQSDYEIPDLAPGDYFVTLSSPFERIPGTDGLTSRTLSTSKITLGPGSHPRVDFKK